MLTLNKNGFFAKKFKITLLLIAEIFSLVSLKYILQNNVKIEREFIIGAPYIEDFWKKNHQ